MSVLPAEPYFWICGLDIRPGAVIEPGNWGRIVRFRGTGHPAIGRELLFERIREEINPNAPSRFDCAFVCPTSEGAERFRRAIRNRWSDLTYEVELENPDAPFFVAKIDLIDQYQNAPTTDHAALARQYWEGTDSTNPSAEILTLSPLRITRRFTRDP